MRQEMQDKRAAKLPRRTTTKVVARALNVSERTVRMAKAIKHSPDLVAAVAAGTMSINRAYRACTGKPNVTGLDRLHAVFRAASTEEKAEFVAWVLDMVERVGEVTA